jgi:3-phosphoshikimate 1-carboxyvinyltransferase
VKIAPAKRLSGRVHVSGDKSVSHRAAIIAALARGHTVIENFSTGADCASTLRCLQQLGVLIERDGANVRIEGVGAYRDLKTDKGARTDESQRRFHPPTRALDCGNSGTTMRLLAGLLAAQGFATVLKGDESLSRRPMRRVIEPLERMGARVVSVEGHAPLLVEGRSPLAAIEHEPSVASAQVKSAVLLAGLGATGRTTVVERGTQTRDHTERMLAWLGAEVETTKTTDETTRATNVRDETHTNARDETYTDARGETYTDGRVEVYTASVVGPARLSARDIFVPGDISSAAFFLAAAAILPGSDLTVEGVGLNPTRAEILRTLRRLGADVRVEDERERCNERVGDVRVGGAHGLTPRAASEGANVTRDGANVLSGAVVARLIDELPVLAVVGTRVEGGLEIRGARELRVKESDRIGATVSNLRAMGAQVEEFDDGLRVEGPVKLRGARLQSFGDHRIAMAFAVAALAAEGDTEIEGADECVGISFPEFFPLLESVTER